MSSEILLQTRRNRLHIRLANRGLGKLHDKANHVIVFTRIVLALMKRVPVNFNVPRLVPRQPRDFLRPSSHKKISRLLSRPLVEVVNLSLRQCLFVARILVTVG